MKIILVKRNIKQQKPLKAGLYKNRVGDYGLLLLGQKSSMHGTVEFLLKDHPL